jgi:hypothetical protein
MDSDQLGKKINGLSIEFHSIDSMGPKAFESSR